MRRYRTIGEVEEEYFRNHLEDVDDYIAVFFDEYAESGDTTALMTSLRVVSRVKGVSRIIKELSLAITIGSKVSSGNGAIQLCSRRYLILE